MNISGRAASGSTLGTTAARTSTSNTMLRQGLRVAEGVFVRPLAERRCGQLQAPHGVERPSAPGQAVHST